MFPNKTFFLVLTIITSSLFGKIYAQQKEDIIGTWKVKKVELSNNITTEEKQKVAQLNAIFLKTTFQFKADSSFFLRSPDKELNQQGVWVFEAEKKNIIVWDKASKGIPGRLMEINVKKYNDDYAFVMLGTPMVLIVSKATITKAH